LNNFNNQDENGSPLLITQQSDRPVVKPKLQVSGFKAFRSLIKDFHQRLGLTEMHKVTNCTSLRFGTNGKENITGPSILSTRNQNSKHSMGSCHFSYQIESLSKQSRWHLLRLYTNHLLYGTDGCAVTQQISTTD